MKALATNPITMSSIEIAELVSSRHDNVKTSIERLAERRIIRLPALQEIPTATKPTKVYIFSGDQGKRDSIVVVAQLSPEFTAALVDRWQELESAVTVQSSSAPSLPDIAAALEIAARMLNCSESGKLLMIGTAFKRHGIDPVGLLPSYAIDAPAGVVTAGSSEPTFSLTHLLDQHGIQISAVRANKQLHAAGFLRQAERKRSGGGLQLFWVITDKGLEYGKNVTSAQNQRQTEPHWYASKFPELAGLMGW